MMDFTVVQAVNNLTGWWRKPNRWAEVGNPVPLRVLESLKRYNAGMLGIYENIAADFSFVPEDPVFIVTRADGAYLVDTQGARYARYVRYIGLASQLPALP